MSVAYTAKIHGIIECWQYYQVCEDYNGVISKVLGDGWLNLRILSVQSLEAHQRVAVTLEDKVPYVSSNFYKAKALQPY